MTRATRVSEKPAYTLFVGGALGGDLPIAVEGSTKRFAGGVAFRGGDVLFAVAPEQLGTGNAPLGALARSADRAVGDDHVDRVCVQLGKLPQRHPTAALDRHLELHVVNLA